MRKRRFASMCLALTSAAILGAGAVGCQSRFPETIPVSGRVTLDGGDWPTDGELRFLPQIDETETLEGHRCRPGTAKFDTSGRFIVKSWEDKAGLMPGKYKVSVECWNVPPTMTGPPPISYVAQVYQTPPTTPLEVVVPRDKESLELSLEVKSH